MSRLGPHFRANGKLRTNIGVGELVDPVEDQAVRLDTSGNIYCVSNGTITHYASGLPFNIHGRLVVSASPVDYWDQGTPFSATGGVCVDQTAISYYDQGMSLDVAGNLTRN